MAEKILNTRIQLKYDTLANWNSSSFILKKGEIAIVEVPTTEGSTLQPVMFKVGDGSKTFSQLDWASAKAADVFGWAKQSNLNITKVGTGNVVAGIEWDATANGGKGGIKFTTASVATSEGFEALGEKVEAIEDDIANNRAAWAQNDNTTYTIAKNGKGITFTPSEGNATSITFDYLTEAEIKALQVDDATHADAATKVDNALTVKVGGANVVFDGSAAKTADVDTAINTAKTALIGDSADQYNTETIYGAKAYADYKDDAVKEALIGTSADASSANTVYGAKKYADEKAAGALSDAKGYVDGKFTEANLAQYTTEQEVKDIVDGVIAGAADSDTYNSLTKLVDYIDAHGGEAADMAEAIETLEGKVDTIEKKPAYAITATQVSNWDNEVGAKALAETKLDATTYNTYVQNHANDYTNTQIDNLVTGARDAAIADAAGKYVTTGDFNTYKLGVTDGTIQVGDAAELGGIAAANYLTKAVAATTYEPIGAEDRAIAALIGQADDDKTEDTIIGARRYADSLAVNYATAAQGALADSALQEITTTANGGLKVTNKNQIDIDDSVVFVFDCGSATKTI